MQRDALERLSKAELIELVLRLQRPEKTSHTSSKPPSTDRKQQRERSKPGGAKPGHEGHSRRLSETASAARRQRISSRPGGARGWGGAAFRRPTWTPPPASLMRRIPRSTEALR